MVDPWAQQVEAQQPSAKPEWLTEALEKSLINNLLPVSQDGLLMLWDRSKKQLDYWKEKEIELRKIVAQVLVPAKTEGTVNVELGNDYKAKVNHKYNYKLKEDNDTVWATLDKISKIGNEGKFIADRLVSWHPSFLKTEYTTLQEEADKGSEQAKVILTIVNNELLTITEAAPELKIIEPKVKK